MKIVAIADIHGRIDRLDIAREDMAAADLTVLTGDVTNFGRREQAARMIGPIEQSAREVLAVPGNCDYPEVEAYLTERGFNLDRRAEERQGLYFVGLGGSLPGPAPTPNEYTDRELAEFLVEAASDLPPKPLFFLVSHQPPAGTAADEVSPGEHVGSAAVRRFIEERQPLACLTGHIHEAASLDRLGSTHVINPGPLPTGSYAYLEVSDGEVSAELRGPGA